MSPTCLEEVPFLDVLGPPFQADPYGTLRALREKSWVVRTPLGYTVIGHPEALAIKRDADVVRIFDAVDPVASPYLAARAAANISSQHGPRLVQLRRTIVQALRPRQVARYREAMAGVAHGLLDDLVGADRADLVAAFGGPYPGLVMSPLLGVPFDQALELDDWATTINELGNHVQYGHRLAVIEAAWRSMEDHLAELIARRRAEPSGDIVSDLVAAADADPALDEDDLLGLAMAVVNASIDNVRAQLCLTLEALLRDRDLWAHVQREPGQVAALVEEGLRLHPAGDDIQHRLLVDKSLFGLDFPAGTLLFISKKGVNRDPRLTDDPDTFRLDRASKDHLTFGFGLHACVGAVLARGALAEALEAVVTRVRDWRPAGGYGRTGVESSGRPLALPVELDVAPRVPAGTR